MNSDTGTQMLERLVKVETRLEEVLASSQRTIDMLHQLMAVQEAMTSFNRRLDELEASDRRQWEYLDPIAHSEPAVIKRLNVLETNAHDHQQAIDALTNLRAEIRRVTWSVVTAVAVAVVLLLFNLK